MIAVADIRATLAAREPRAVADDERYRAAVAAILHEEDGHASRLLVIERARRRGDPWSGDLAFPGGRVKVADADERAAAERETLEEVGLDLTAAEYLGRLDDLDTNVLPMTVAGFVYTVDEMASLELSDEVHAAFWAATNDLVDAGRQRQHRLLRGDRERHFPAIDLLGPGRPLLWGVTYRFVRDLLAMAGHELPTEPARRL